MRDLLMYLSCINEGDWLGIYMSVKKIVRPSDEQIKEMKKKITSQYITIIDDEYPIFLRNTINPPYVLFYKGNISLLNDEKSIAVIGARKCSKYGADITKELVIDLVKHDYTIVSGMAKGIDSIAHFTALEEKGSTIAVVGSGLNYIYPKENLFLQEKIIKKGLVISEYPDFVKPKAEHYPARNRLIAAFSKALLVTDAKYRSGTMITVRYGLDLGKDIFCVPHNIYAQSGCNLLIKQGATLIESASDIISFLK